MIEDIDNIRLAADRCLSVVTLQSCQFTLEDNIHDNSNCSHSTKQTSLSSGDHIGHS